MSFWANSRPPDPALAAVADGWFRALDGHPVRIGSRRFRTRITGIHSGDDRTLWIQVEAVASRKAGIVLHVTPESSVSEALAALEQAWVEPMAERSVIEVTRAA